MFLENKFENDMYLTNDAIHCLFTTWKKKKKVNCEVFRAG
jgi:hypothetical protein